MNFILWIIGLVIFFGLCLWIYKTYLEDLLDFVLETNDDVDQFKKDKQLKVTTLKRRYRLLNIHSLEWYLHPDLARLA